jgi:hypothetical protein
MGHKEAPATNASKSADLQRTQCVKQTCLTAQLRRPYKQQLRAGLVPTIMGKSALGYAVPTVPAWRRG